MRKFNLAIAVETKKHPKNQTDYRIWYLVIGNGGNVEGVGVKTKGELIESLFANYRQSGESHWRAFLKNAAHSSPIEASDFISKNSLENTHFGNLPTLSEFQATLDSLQTHFEMCSIA